MVGGHSDTNVQRDQKETFEIVALLVLQEATNRDNRQNQHDKVEDLEVEVHLFPQTPSHDDRKGTVEECSLQRCSKNVRQGKIHLVVPGLVNGCQMLSKLLHERHEDQADEGIRDVRLFNDVVNLQDKNDGNEGDEGDADGKGYEALRHCELRLDLVVLVTITLFVILEYRVVYTVVCTSLEKDEHDIGDDEENGNDARHVESSGLEILCSELVSAQPVTKYGWYS